MKIIEIISERVVDPALLAQRVAGRYGKRTKYGYWEPPVKQQNIPMRSFNQRAADAVYRAYFDARSQFAQQVDPSLPRRQQDEEVSVLFRQLFSPVSMDIRTLIATQPFVRINDPEMLQQKLGDTDPKISVATYRGRNYIMDGHHAVVAAALRGDRQVLVSHIDLDRR